MKNKSWISALFIAFIIVTAVLVRIYYVSMLMENVEINETIYNAAKVGSEGIKFSGVFADGVSLKSLYVCSLYAAFIVFGNFTVAGVYLNIAYQLITVLLIFAAVRNVSNRYMAFGVSFIVSVFPMYVRKLSQVTAFDMGMAFGALALVILTGIFNIIFRYVKAKRNTDSEIVNEETVEQTVYGQNEIKPFTDTSMKEIHIDEKEEKKINYIENPLPVPKRKKHKEMNFAVSLTDENDDYDLNDMSGKDFYDIE